MRSVDGCECELTNEAIEARLEHAYATLFKLPKDSGHRLKVATYGYVSEVVEPMQMRIGRIIMSASRLDIGLMDEAVEWIRFIDNLTIRRIVSLRSMVHPVTERHMYPWSRVATALRADSRAIKCWHDEGLTTIRRRLWLDGG